MKIICLLADGFEDSEFEKPYGAFRNAGHTVEVVGLKAGQQVEGDKGRVKAKVERDINSVRPQELDTLFIPGGRSPDKLRANEQVVRFTREMVDAGKPVFAICHGPQLLLAAERIKDHTMTAWTTVRGDLEKAGARVVDKPVAVDSNIVTSRKPDDIPMFISESLAILTQMQNRRAA